MIGLLGALFERLFDLLYERRCGGCDQPAREPICPACLARWPGLAGSRCGQCLEASGEPQCDRCRLDPPPYDAVVALGGYRGVAREAIRTLKYRGRRAIARSLGRAIAAHPALPEGDWLVVPIPLHGKRRRSRGYNQAALIARAIAREKQWRCVPGALRRTRATTPQHGLDRDQRWANLEGAFAARGRLQGCRVLLVDDVMTTGATIEEASWVLKAAGVSEVRVAVVARAGQIEA